MRSREAQIDIVAINWMEKAILLGECKWSRQPVGRSVVAGLMKKTPGVVPAGEWRVHHTVFARAGFTGAARSEAEKHGALLVDLERLDRDLQR